MIDVVSITRAARLRRMRMPSVPTQPVFAPEPPAQDALFPAPRDPLLPLPRSDCNIHRRLLHIVRNYGNTSFSISSRIKDHTSAVR